MFIILIMSFFSILIAGIQLLAAGNVLAGASLLGSSALISTGTMYFYKKKSAAKKFKKALKLGDCDCCDVPDCDCCDVPDCGLDCD
ncbi:hypothetical protein [Thermoflavimicrobium dichotomicum]|uniref:Uncharacterized protein n=1 Tax=Thermoflavimicrobium dichotomicum TaxID=46223 RepID=A0A1I3RLB0_9BACL|nr:hypothetical protein [Thermoflavimicrobium dichotomicum]SFJ46081.1 hypothetical protein SAMN05421852_11044 [Thermoflavimicrobium dichotomicum]